MSVSHLSVHSHYSLLDGLPQIPDLVKQAAEYDMPSLALTDRNNLYGAIEFYKACKKAGIKPIIGVDLTIEIGGVRGHLVLIALSLEGYRNVVKLVSAAQLQRPGDPYASEAALGAHAGGIAALVPESALRAGGHRLAEAIVRAFGKENVFARLGWNGTRDAIARAAEAARGAGLPLIAGDGVYYLADSDRDARDIVRRIANPGAERDGNDRAFLAPNIFLERYREFPEAIENTRLLSERADVSLSLGSWVFPKFPIPAGTTYEAELEKAVQAGFHLRGMEKTPNTESRIAYELSIINKKGFAPYFLVVADLLRFARENGILTTTRGSAAGSLVSYLTGITNVDPILYELPFERFLNPERPKAPDIDMDFADTKRDRMIAYAREKYGEKHVAQIGTFGTMMARAAVRDVARSLGFGYGTGDRIAKLIPFGSQGFPMTIEKALEMEEELRSLYRSDEDAETIINTARRVEGNARHISIHAAGIVIAPGPVTDFVPVQWDPHGESVITQYNMHAVEDAGLLKFDFLGLTILSILGDAVERVRARTGTAVDVENLPLDDAKVYAMLGRGETEGVFQLGGGGMTRYLKDLEPSSIHDINAMVALYRPGPMESIPEYIARKRNPALVSYLDPRMEKILDRSYGIITYQDDVLLIAIEIAGYSWLEADNLRKAMGKKIPAEMEAQKEKFIEGCVEHGKIDRAKAQAIWRLIEPFAAYGFNKCVTGDTRIYNPVTGSVDTVMSLHTARGRIPVVSLTPEQKLSASAASWVRENGVKPVYRLTTRSGRILRATGNHPLLCFDGWRPLETIVTGTRVAVPRRVPSPHNAQSVPPHEAAALGYLLSEGNLCHPHGLYFYSTQENEIADFTKATLCFPNTRVTLNRSKRAVSAYVARKVVGLENGMFVWARALGILGKRATEKQMPTSVFTWNNDLLSLCIGKLWQGDGSCSLKNQQLFYATSSTQLAHDVQHILLRFSILSTIHTKRFRYRGGVRVGFTVVITGTENVSRFANAIAPHLIGSKQSLVYALVTLTARRTNNRGRGTHDTVPASILNDIRTEAARKNISITALAAEAGISVRLLSNDSRKRGYTRSTIAQTATVLKSTALMLHAESDIFWDEVKHIEFDGEEMTYDLTVPGYENFVANDIIVHNSHAASYGKVAYQTAYMKAHFPADYMASLMTADAGNTEKIAVHVGECMRLGINVLPPDVNQSGSTFTVIDDTTVRFGLDSIKNFGEGAARAVIAERENAPYASLGDFASRMGGASLNRRGLEALIKSGALDAFGDRKGMRDALDTIVAAQQSRAAAPENQGALFALDAQTPVIDVPQEDTTPLAEKLAWEKELLGIYVSGHPLDRHREALNADANSIRAAREEDRNGFPLVVLGIVETVKSIITKKGDRMCFVTLADREASIEAVAFPKVFQAAKDALQAGNCVLVKGTLSRRNDEPSLLIDKVKKLD